jgi:DNA-binding CsgD family transcriptional regulator
VRAARSPLARNVAAVIDHEVTSVLEHLGASLLEDQLYRHLVTVPSATLPVLATVTGAEPASVAGALTELQRRGLVGRNVGEPVSYVAAAPEVAVEAALREREASLYRARGELAELVDIHRSALRARNGSEIVEVVADPDAFRRRILALAHSARDETLSLVRPPFVALDDKTAWDNRLRTPSIRIIYDRSIFDAIPDVVGMLREEVRPGSYFRLHSDVPLKLLVFDRSTALLAAAHRPGRTTALLIVHSSPLLDALIGFFELLWGTAAPFPGLDHEVPDGTPTEPPPLDQLDRHLLSLMLTGLTDQAIAGHLGIGLRSVQRRIHDLMARTGVQTRIQLGWHAAQEGWLPDTRPGRVVG